MPHPTIWNINKNFMQIALPKNEYTTGSITLWGELGSPLGRGWWTKNGCPDVGRNTERPIIINNIIIVSFATTVLRW